ncbi:MAG: DMT family transporter [Eubacteriales bacterium]|nr:DMT family transporter [Eubacteriales bacterium]
MNEKVMQKTIVVWVGALICCALWGSAFPCIKIGYAWMHIASSDTWTQILYAGTRFTLAGLLVILLGSIMQRRLLLPQKQTIPKVFRLCMLQTVLQYLFFYIGLAHTDGTKASIIEGMNVFVAILIASILFRQEKLTLRKTIGCMIGFIGVLLVNVSGKSVDLHMSMLGEGFIFFSTVSYAFSSVLIKKYSKEENPVLLSGWQFLTGGLIMAISGFAMGGRLETFTWKSGGMLLYLAMVSAVAYTLWSLLLTYNSVSRVAVFGFMNPVFGFILSAILLKESQAFSLIAIASLVLVCIGIYIVNKNEKNVL